MGLLFALLTQGDEVLGPEQLQAERLPQPAGRSEQNSSAFAVALGSRDPGQQVKSHGQAQGVVEEPLDPQALAHVRGRVLQFAPD